jgi:hypothetical protein
LLARVDVAVGGVTLTEVSRRDVGEVVGSRLVDVMLLWAEERGIRVEMSMREE